MLQLFQIFGACLVYPCTAFNFSQNVWCYKHKDVMNCPFGFCAIITLGKFDSKKVSHLIHWKLRLVLEIFSSLSISIVQAASSNMLTVGFLWRVLFKRRILKSISASRCWSLYAGSWGLISFQQYKMELMLALPYLSFIHSTAVSNTLHATQTSPLHHLYALVIRHTCCNPHTSFFIYLCSIRDLKNFFNEQKIFCSRTSNTSS